MSDQPNQSGGTEAAALAVCVRCGADLGDCPGAAPCPACGLPAERSRERPRLADFPASWLALQLTGTLILLLALGLQTIYALFLLGRFFGGNESAYVLRGAFLSLWPLLTGAAQTAALVMMSWMYPALAAERPLRRWLPVAIIAIAVSAFVAQLLLAVVVSRLWAVSTPRGATVLWVVYMVPWSLGTVASVLVVAWVRELGLRYTDLPVRPWAATALGLILVGPATRIAAVMAQGLAAWDAEAYVFSLLYNLTDLLLMGPVALWAVALFRIGGQARERRVACPVRRQQVIPAAVARAMSLESDLACVGCNYNLRGLTADRTCPECGLPVLESLRPVELPLHQPGAEACLRTGLLCLLISLAITTVTLHGIWLVAALQILGGVLVGLAALVEHALWFVGAWLITRPDCASARISSGWRWLTRLFTLLNGVAWLTLLASLGLMAIDDEDEWLAMLFGSVAFLFLFRALAVVWLGRCVLDLSRVLHRRRRRPPGWTAIYVLGLLGAFALAGIAIVADVGALFDEEWVIMMIVIPIFAMPPISAVCLAATIMLGFLRRRVGVAAAEARAWQQANAQPAPADGTT